MRHPTPDRPPASTVVGLLLACTLLGACNANGDTLPADTGELRDTPAQPGLVSRLPEQLDSFAYAGYRHFDDGSGGYSFRYRNRAKKRLADVYVYPVAEQNSALDHRTLVMGSTRATLRAIDEAVEQGVYANFQVVDSATRATGLRMVSRVQATYLRENLASYTMLYQSEHAGTLMKIRLSMPDNPPNRSSREWDVFAEHMFRLVIDDMNDRAGPDALAAPAGPAAARPDAVPAPPAGPAAATAPVAAPAPASAPVGGTTPRSSRGGR